MSDPYEGEVTVIEAPRAVSVPAGDVTNAEFTDHETRITTLEGAQAGELDDLSDVDTSTSAPASGDLLQFDGTNWVSYTPAAIPVSFNVPFPLDGGGAGIAAGAWYAAGIVIPSSATITGFILDGNDEITMQVQRSTAADPDSWSTISGSEHPSLAFGLTTVADHDLTTWSTSLAQYDRLRVNVTAADATFATLNILCTREVGP